MAAFWITIRAAVVLLATLIFETSTASYSPLISNGTCYYQPHKKANSVYAPAGNEALNHTFCCQLGDKINSHNACVFEQLPYIYTYIAGCTDPTYEHPSCPQKANYSNFQWVGMVACDDTDEEGLVTWVGCPNDGSAVVKPSTISEGCQCDLEGPNRDQELFRAGTGLVAFGFLPTAKGEQIGWIAGHTPPSNPADPTATNSDVTSSLDTLATSVIYSSTATSATSVSYTRTTSLSTSTPSISNISNSASGEDKLSKSLPAGAKAGIAISSISGTFLIVLFILLCGKCWKRRGAELDNESRSEKPQSLRNQIKIDVPTSELDSSSIPHNKLELPDSTPRYQAYNVSPTSPILSSPSWSVPLSPTQRDQVYQPFRYQPSPTIKDIQEMPDDRRPQWALTGFGTYGPDQASVREQEIENGEGNVHELPG